ncbi:DNA-binding protein [Polyangium aurulentum]|uniref:DNA-binding protein n=1 Tax=Polyangium aurulentum TaxID=2567896 RepID=UPI001F40AD0F|nr:DNA-binding protein [Polyangium aurulentum]
MKSTRHATALLTLALAALAAGCGESEPNNPQEPELKTIPIAEARALPAGTTAKIEGFVTVVPSTFESSTGEKGFALQDDTGGIYVSVPDGVIAGFGAKASITGKLAQMKEQTVLMADPKTIEPGGETKEVTPEDVKTGEVNESTEGRLVRVTGQVTQAVADDQPYGYKVFVDDGSGEVQVYVSIVASMPIIDTTAIMMGGMIEVTGLAGQYEETYEVMPRRPEDLVMK